MAAKGINVMMGEIKEWSRWKIALCVGTPLAVGVAGLWYWNRRRANDSAGADDKATKGTENATKVPPAEQKPLEKAQAAKNKGNKYFKGGKYEEAIKCYTEAIELCPQEHRQDIATFYQNRAAAYEQLKKYDNVITDCGNALERNNRYTKALFRRAKACELTGNLMQCLEDVTAVCILENFGNPQSLIMAERVLKELGKQKAKEAIKNRKPVEPSKQFIRTYFSTFKNDPIMSLIETLNADEGSEPEKDRDESPEKEKVAELNKNAESPTPFKKALDCIKSKDFDDILRLSGEEIARESSPHLAESLLLRGTFYLLRGEGDEALNDFNRLLGMEGIEKRLSSNALIKRGSLRMQNGEQTNALDDFATAARQDPDNSDIYHHRGQLNLLIDRIDDAVKDFEKSVQLSPDFAIAHVQKCYTEYRQAFATRSPMMLQTAMTGFQEALEKFSDCAEGYALYGQALCDQQEFEKADSNFEKALELEPDNGNIYVHRGLLKLQWKQDVEEASRLINKAVEVDDKCEFAYETLGTLEVQRGNLDRSIELFHKSISLAKTEIEMAHLYSLLDAAVAQSQVAKNFGLQVPLAGMGMGM